MEAKDYPEAIENLQNVVIGLGEYISDLKDELRGQDDKFFFMVLHTQNEAGKPAYTNEPSREAAMRNLQRDCIAWRKLNNDIRRVTSEKAENEAKLERLRGEFKLLLIDKFRLRETLFVEIPEIGVAA